MVGIGPDTAVTLLITIGDNPERLASEASFAALCGVSPVERSSGSRQFRRLNRGATGRPTPPCTGSCRLACASTRAPRTTTNAASMEGKTSREIVRCLKRYAAREVFHLIRVIQSCPPS
ncbi:transposase [Streptomyces sp. R35]|uniref:Transposase n=1 Tax=Streptomyces sp. R35 TaxID=3238630 RepID=A0AB39SP61_9ACTN